jgi:sugar phosphate isomerase/epimerase
MLLGLVSNVWNVQLAAGEDLADLVAAAAARGYRVIELRQKSLGGYESERDHLPDVAGLAALARRFPELRFVAAYEAPFLHPDTGPHDRYFEAAVSVARAVAQERQPHVRLVDLSTTAEQIAACGADAAGQTIARLTAALADDATLLSVENAWQPWPLLAAAIAAARTALGTAAGRLRICFDPCNFAFIQEPTDAAAVLASLSPEQVGMLHFKQRRNGRLEPTVAAGDVDWPRLIPVIVERGLFGQALFEMASHEQLWRNLELSSACLQRLWRRTGTDEPWG